MSQQEFETYLSVLCRLLRVKAEQREQIAEELRDHMESRLDELAEQGVPHDEAVRQALDEFGDAAGLATSFFSITRQQRRRWVMRVTTISAVGVAAAVMVAVALWPEAKPGFAPRQAVAQFGGGGLGGGAPVGGEAKAAAAPAQASTRKATALEEKLAARVSVEFIETPLKDVLIFLSDIGQVQFYVNQKALDGEGVATDAAISLTLKDVRLDTILDLVLEQLDGGLAYAERDGLLIISTSDRLADRLEVRVYNCRDLLTLSLPQPAAGAMGMMMGSGMMPPGAAGSGSGAPSGPMGTGGMMSMGSGGGAMAGMGGGGMGGGPPRSGFGAEHDARAQHLMYLLTQTVKPETWAEMGGLGSISEYGGLLVVRQTPQTHRDVDDLLGMLRTAAATRAEKDPAAGAKAH